MSRVQYITRVVIEIYVKKTDNGINKEGSVLCNLSSNRLAVQSVVELCRGCVQEKLFCLPMPVASGLVIIIIAGLIGPAPGYSSRVQGRGVEPVSTGMRGDTTMYCEQCGSELTDELAFCDECGALVGDPLGTYDEDEYSADTWYERGIGYDQEGHYLEAVGAYRRALDLDREFYPALFNCGLDLNVLGRYEEALALFTRAVALDPGDALAHMNRAIALYGLLRNTEGDLSYRRAKELKPDLVIDGQGDVVTIPGERVV
jgi:tetratricopeptide (TPR) repeat protein